MQLFGDRFVIVEPDGWTRTQDRSRYVFEGPLNEALIVSGFLVSGAGTSEEEQALDAKHLAIATRNVQLAASVSDLVITRPFERIDLPGFDAWVVETKEREGSGLFLEAVVHLPGGVLLVTFEGPDA